MLEWSIQSADLIITENLQQSSSQFDGAGTDERLPKHNLCVFHLGFVGCKIIKGGKLVRHNIS